MGPASLVIPGTPALQVSVCRCGFKEVEPYRTQLPGRIGSGITGEAAQTSTFGSVT